MAERNKHPEIDIQTPVRALIGLEPQQDPPETKPEEALDIPSLIRLFQTDAYPPPESAPLQITVGKETSLTLYPQDEALEYRQQTPEHTFFCEPVSGERWPFLLRQQHRLPQRKIHNRHILQKTSFLNQYR
jgi:hypothetical protein